MQHLGVKSNPPTVLFVLMMVLTMSELCSVSSPSSLVPAALQSVFPKAGLGAFMVLLKRDKEQQLNELTMIVTGIRLLNKAIETGGEENDLHEFSTAHQLTCSLLFEVLNTC